MSLYHLQNVNFGYQQSLVLQNLDLKLEPGLFYGIIGPNGSGKTSLLELLCALHHPWQGNIFFKNKNLRQCLHRDLARHIALIPQQADLTFDFKVHEVVLMGRSPHLSRFARPSQEDYELVQRALQRTGLKALQTRPVTKISGGERQRLLVARALAQDCPVLLADEANSSLDIEHSLLVFKEMKKEVDQGKTVIAVIHDLNLAARFCDILIVLNKGQVWDIGNIKKILNIKLLQDVFHIQTQISWDEFTNSYTLSYR